MLKKTVMALGAVLLGAAAVSLAALSIALLLGFVALVVVAVAGLYLCAPDEAKALLQKLPSYIDGWIKDMRTMVRDAGETLLTAMGKKPAREASAEAQTGVPSGEGTQTKGDSGH